MKEYRIQLVDYRGEAVATFGRAACHGTEAVGIAFTILSRWNGRAVDYPNPVFADGFLVWDETGALISYA